MSSLNLYDQYECNQAYMNNLCELESVVSQYIEISHINTELVDRIICKIMMNEKYDKINILIVELNRLLNQYYLPYHIQIASDIDDIVSVKINDVNNIIYGKIDCVLNVIDATTANLQTTINDVTTTTQVTVGQTVTVEFLDLTILLIAETSFCINIEENTLVTLTYNNVVQDLKLYILDMNQLVELEDNYNQQSIIEDTTSIKEKLDCHKQYLIEKMDLICKYKKKLRGGALSCKMVGTY